MRPVDAVMRPPSGLDAAARADGNLEAGSRRGDVRDAAVQFEAVMLRQMVEALRKATKMGGEEESGHQMTDHLIEDALANHLAKAGGIGLADTIASSVEERHSLPRADMHLILERGLRFTPLTPAAERPGVDPDGSASEAGERPVEPANDAVAPTNR